MVAKALFSSNTDDWSTPDDLFNALDAEFHFTLDAASSDSNAKCVYYFTTEDNGLVQSWGRNVVWCNPPYGRVIGQWMAKAYYESKNGCRVVCLVPARTDTRWFHDFVYKKPNVEIRFLKGRLRFGGCRKSAPFPSMLVIYNPMEG